MLSAFISLGKNLTKKPQTSKKPSTFCEILQMKQILLFSFFFQLGLEAFSKQLCRGGRLVELRCREQQFSPISCLSSEWNNLPDTYSMLLFPPSVIQAVLLLLFLSSVFPDGFQQESVGPPQFFGIIIKNSMSQILTFTTRLWIVKPGFWFPR